METGIISLSPIYKNILIRTNSIEPLLRTFELIIIRFVSATAPNPSFELSVRTIKLCVMEKIETKEGLKRVGEFIQTLRPDGKPGESIPKEEYDTWSYFILSSLASSEELTLTELLEKADQKTSLPEGSKVDSKVSWYVLQVKRDLETRGLIKVMPSAKKKHTFLIQLTRQGMSKIHYQFQVSEWSDGNH